LPRPRIYNTEAIVLRSNPLGEADRLLTLLTPTLGKLQATARGARKTTSKLGGHVDVLTRSSMALARGQSIDTITSADTLETFIPVKSNLEKLSRAVYLAELVDMLSPLESPSPTIYALFLESLRALEAKADMDTVVRYTEIQLLSCSGFLPELQECTECRTSVTPGQHYFSPAAGGILCPSCRTSHPDAFNISLNALKVLRFFSTSSISSALLLRIDPPLHRELAAIISAYLRYVLEREPRSIAFLHALSRLAAHPVAHSSQGSVEATLSR